MLAKRHRDKIWGDQRDKISRRVEVTRRFWGAGGGTREFEAEVTREEVEWLIDKLNGRSLAFEERTAVQNILEKLTSSPSNFLAQTSDQVYEKSILFLEEWIKKGLNSTWEPIAVLLVQVLANGFFLESPFLRIWVIKATKLLAQIVHLSPSERVSHEASCALGNGLKDQPRADWIDIGPVSFKLSPTLKGMAQKSRLGSRNSSGMLFFLSIMTLKGDLRLSFEAGNTHVAQSLFHCCLHFLGSRSDEEFDSVLLLLTHIFEVNKDHPILESYLVGNWHHIILESVYSKHQQIQQLALATLLQVFETSHGSFLKVC